MSSIQTLITISQKNKISFIKLDIKHNRFRIILAVEVQSIRSKQANFIYYSSYRKPALLKREDLENKNLYASK